MKPIEEIRSPEYQAKLREEWAKNLGTRRMFKYRNYISGDWAVADYDLWNGAAYLYARPKDVTEPVKPTLPDSEWEKYPWANWAAWDLNDEEWWLYDKRPTISKTSEEWNEHPERENCEMYLGSYPSCDWKDSLIERPEHLRKKEPVMVELEAKYVPPGSVISKDELLNTGWMAVSEVTIDSVVLCFGGDTSFMTMTELREGGYWIKRPGEAPAKCEKEAK